jgi:hypothetical protein
MRTILAAAATLTIGLFIMTTGEADATTIIKSKSNICNNRGGSDNCDSGDAATVGKAAAPKTTQGIVSPKKGTK